jgi:hypothetical protein
MEDRVLTKLEKYCEDTGLTKTVAMERILDKFLTEREKQKVNKEENHE